MASWEDRQTVRGVAIVWSKSERVRGLVHGTVGGLRFFTIRSYWGGEELTSYLPGKFGPRELETFKTPALARQRAGEILGELLGAMDKASPLSVISLPEADLESA